MTLHELYEDLNMYNTDCFNTLNYASLEVSFFYICMFSLENFQIESFELTKFTTYPLKPLSELKTLEWDILNPDRIINLEIKNERRTSNI